MTESTGQLLLYRDGSGALRVRIDGQTVWLTQRQLAELYQISVPTINEHIKSIVSDQEVDSEATIRKYRMVQTEGSRDVSRMVEHYALDVIIAVGYRVRSTRGTDFCRWATAQLRDLVTKGFVLDDERIKEGRTLGADYFDELLERIRDIRASERLFHEKVAAIYATSIDYDPKSELSRSFFAVVQNKLHHAVHGRTAPELVRERADASKPNMGLTTWKQAPEGAIRTTDVGVAKNYLTEDELRELNRIVTMYLDYAEDQARRHAAMHMADWIDRLDNFLRFNERDVLGDAGSVSRDMRTTPCCSAEQADGSVADLPHQISVSP
jgi:hypothetical protein